MSNDITLHCFPGDISSLALLLLADHIGLDLKTRYLKPANVAEKFYKVSLTKKFPMLEVKTADGYYLIERAACIARFLTDDAKTGVLCDRKEFGYARGNQNMEVLGQYVLPALVTLRTMRAGIIEEDRQLDGQLIGELQQQLTNLDTIISKQADTPLNHADFFLFVSLRAAHEVGCLNPTLKSLTACNERFRRLTEDAKLAALLAPYDPARVN